MQLKNCISNNKIDNNEYANKKQPLLQKKELHFTQKGARIFKENVNGLHFCNFEAYTEIS